MSISLNKYISQTGICSRREADRWIEQKRVKINGKVAIKGNRVSIGDKVSVDGKRIVDKTKKIYMAFHKPPGITCTTDLKDKSNIIDYIGYPERIFPIGRLDKPSSGLILLTNDGDIVNALLREENEEEKIYVVTVDKPIMGNFVKRMENGIPILGTITKKCKVEKISSHRFKIILTQGLNRQIRRMCEYLGYKVVTLKRVQFKNVKIDNLPPGKWRMLTKKEIEILKKSSS